MIGTMYRLMLGLIGCYQNTKPQDASADSILSRRPTLTRSSSDMLKYFRKISGTISGLQIRVELLPLGLLLAGVIVQALAPRT